MKKLAPLKIYSFCAMLFSSAAIAAAYIGYMGTLIPSSVHREVASTQMTVAQERSAGAFSASYREVPVRTKDDDGFDPSSPIVRATRPSVTCGDGLPTVDDRIADCLAKNPATATWDGAANGIGPEASWKLVTFTAGGKEVWRDERTQLLWSDDLGASVNWCQASGNAQSDDPSGYCNNALYQDQTTPTSLCAEGSGLSTPGGYDDTKGGMLSAASSASPSVRWRLPSTYDWQQATLDGMAAVLPNLIGNTYWSTTVYSSDRAQAYFYRFVLSPMWTVQRDQRTTAYSIRCIGAAL